MRRMPVLVRLDLAVGIVALLACVLVERTGEGHVESRLADAARLSAQIADADAIVADRPSLLARRTQLRTQLGIVLRPVDLTARVASFVAETARIAALRRTSIASIVPDGASAEPIAFVVALDGEYADVLATIADFATLTYPAAISIASVARKNPNGAQTTVTAAIHVRLEAAPAGSGA